MQVLWWGKISCTPVMYVTTLASLLVTCYVIWQDNMLCPDGVHNLKNGEDDMNTFAYISATPPLIHSLWHLCFPVHYVQKLQAYTSSGKPCMRAGNIQYSHSSMPAPGLLAGVTHLGIEKVLCIVPCVQFHAQWWIGVSGTSGRLNYNMLCTLLRVKCL